MKYLITGGTGYIGSFMTSRLVRGGHEVFVIDNLERSSRESINPSANFFKIDIRERDKLNSFFKENRVEAVLHFAGLISVAESQKNPELYEEVNVRGSENLFLSAIENNIKNFIFSSTAAVYGNPEIVPIPENHVKKPTSKYGETKLKTEEKLIELGKSDPEISFACLRYFNAAGAELDGSMGEVHNPETHIIPLAIKSAIEKKPFKLYGVDYDTFDGTCIRDYIHVLDLVEAHTLALNKIIKDKGEYFYNVGTGQGISNRQVIEAVKRISGLDIEVREEARREGDAGKLVADPQNINKELNFSPKYSDLETIVESAWKWHSR